MQEFLKSSTRIIHKLENSLLVVALISMLTMALVQIFLRNFFDSGILWAESFLRILVLWVGVLGAMVATREDNHINIDVISRYLSSTWQKIARLIGNLFAAVICALVSWHSLTLVQFEYVDETIAFGVVPMWICQAILPVGFGIMSLRFVINALKGLLARRES